MPGVRLDNPSLYAKDMYKAAYEVIDAVDTVYDKVFKVEGGKTGAGDKNTQLLGLGDLQRHTVEGQDIDFQSPTEGWSYYVRYWTFSGGLTLTFEAVQDTVKLGNFLKDLAGTWQESSINTKEEFAARVFNQGGALSGDYVFNGSHTGQSDPSGDGMYDGTTANPIPLFNLTGNTRSTKGGGTYFNSVASLTLTPGNFETIYNRQTATNNRSELDRPKKNKVDTILVSPGADFLQARRILKSEQLPGSQVNDINPYFDLAQPLAWDYLTDSAFYVGKAQHRDFQFHDRQKPLIDFFEDKTNKGFKASFVERYGVLLKTFTAWGRGGGSSS